MAASCAGSSRWLVGLVALAGCASSEARPLGAAPTEAAAKAERYDSQQYDFEWVLSPGWELVQPETLALSDASLVREVAAARPRGGANDRVLLAVSETALPAQKTGEAVAPSLAGLGAYAEGWLAARRLTPSTKAPTTLFGREALRVDAAYGRDGLAALELALFADAGRRFEIRCLTNAPSSGLPCGDAFAALTIRPRASDATPRALHLRAPRFGLAFEPPDDGWLAVGPSYESAGHTLAWTWLKEERRIAIVLADLTGRASAPFEHLVLAEAAKARAQGETVTVSPGTLAGEACAHLERTAAADRVVDEFVQRRGTIFYSVSIAGPSRDAALVARALAGVHIGDASP
jgi:hypothetical protein